MKIFEIKNHYFLVVMVGGLLLFLSACCSNTETTQKEIDKSQYETNNGYVDNIRPEDEEDIVFNEMMVL